MTAKASSRFSLGTVGEDRRTAEPMQANFPELSEMAQVVSAEFGVKVSSRVAVLDDSFAVVIGRVDGPGIVHFESNLAREELPHCSSLGKVLLSHLSETQVRAIVGRTGLPARTAATITDVEWLLRELEEARARGFAVDDEEDCEGVFCVAAPVLDRRGTCVAAISEHRRTAEPMQANFSELSEMAQVIAAEFGVKVSSRVAVLDESFAVVIGRVDRPGTVHFESNLARQELPHCSGLGKVLLSHLSETQVRAVVGRTGLPARTAATITDVEWLLRELEEARARGFAVDDEEDSEGVFCVAAPVVDRRGRCVAAISVTGLKLSLPVGGIEGIGEIVRRYAAEISAKIGAGQDAATDEPIGPQ